jgi:hypothetical protein
VLADLYNLTGLDQLRGADFVQDSVLQSAKVVLPQFTSNHQQAQINRRSGSDGCGS